MNTKSYPGYVCGSKDEAWRFGAGGIWYDWQNNRRKFPDDVKIVNIMMLVDESHEIGDVSFDDYILPIQWHVSEPNNGGAQWELSGTHDEPTLSPSLHWINVWHGHLKAGKLESC